MEKNLNCYYLIAIFFGLALLFCMGPVNGRGNESVTTVIPALNTGPPADFVMDEMTVKYDMSFEILKIESMAYSLLIISSGNNEPTNERWVITPLLEYNLRNTYTYLNINNLHLSAETRSVNSAISLYRAREKI